MLCLVVIQCDIFYLVGCQHYIYGVYYPTISWNIGHYGVDLVQMTILLTFLLSREYCSFHFIALGIYFYFSMTFGFNIFRYQAPNVEKSKSQNNYKQPPQQPRQAWTPYNGVTEGGYISYVQHYAVALKLLLLQCNLFLYVSGLLSVDSYVRGRGRGRGRGQNWSRGGYGNYQGKAYILLPINSLELGAFGTYYPFFWMVCFLVLCVFTKWILSFVPMT